MKFKEFAWKLFGVGSISVGFLILASYFYKDASMQYENKVAVEQSVIYVANSGDIAPVFLEDTAIEEVSSDQIVEEVKTYTNVIEIPSINVKAYIHDGCDKEALSGGVGWHMNTVRLGEIGNCVIAGHGSATYHCIFNDLNQLEVLDTFYGYDAEGVQHKYYVTQTFISEPGNVGILNNTHDGLSTVTLYTCANRGTMRFVVVGKEFNEEELLVFEEQLKEGYVKDMVAINEGLFMEDIRYEVGLRSAPRTRRYDVDFALLRQGQVLSTKEMLYGLTDNEHVFPSDFYLNIGINLENRKVGGVDDVSEG